MLLFENRDEGLASLQLSARDAKLYGNEAKKQPNHSAQKSPSAVFPSTCWRIILFWAVTAFPD